jgi:hypothetical protein
VRVELGAGAVVRAEQHEILVVVVHDDPVVAVDDLEQAGGGRIEQPEVAPREPRPVELGYVEAPSGCRDMAVKPSRSGGMAPAGVRGTAWCDTIGSGHAPIRS